MDVSTLLGEKKGKKGEAPTPGPTRFLITTSELEETLKKSRGETSGVLQAMQKFYDDNTKTYTDSKAGSVTKVDCRLSWLTAFPVGSKEIDTSAFKGAFGENTSHGLASRMIFGFGEKPFDGRRTRNWFPVPYPAKEPTKPVMIADDYMAGFEEMEFHSPCNRLMGSVVTGWESLELEEEFYDWNPKANLSGRDTYHIQKISIIVAILNGHSKITRADWEFCKAFMAWQNEIRHTFSTGSAKRVTQGEFNETVMDELTKRTKRLMLTGKGDKHSKIKTNDAGTPFYYIRWKQPANSLRWYRYGMDVERTIDLLTKTEDLFYLEEIEEKGGKEVVVKNNAWVRVITATANTSLKR